MTTEEEKENAAAEVQAAVQKVMNHFLKGGFGPDSTAFCLGVCLSATLSLLQKSEPETSEQDHAERILPIFFKGLGAKTIPITTGEAH